MTPPAMLCLSPHTWTHGTHRLGALMARLAVERRVYVLEPATRGCTMPLLGASRIGEITLLTPYLPHTTRCGDPPALAPLVEALLDGDGVEMPILWVSDADTLPSVAGLRTSAVIYDCPPASDHGRAGRCEAEVLARADVVLASRRDDARRLAAHHDDVRLLPEGERDGETSGAATHAVIRDALATLDAAARQTPSLGGAGDRWPWHTAPPAGPRALGR